VSGGIAFAGAAGVIFNDVVAAVFRKRRRGSSTKRTGIFWRDGG
jgi:hypothetical protein